MVMNEIHDNICSGQQVMEFPQTDIVQSVQGNHLAYFSLTLFSLNPFKSNQMANDVYIYNICICIGSAL